jgi:hypothetical protein
LCRIADAAVVTAAIMSNGDKIVQANGIKRLALSGLVALSVAVGSGLLAPRQADAAWHFKGSWGVFAKAVPPWDFTTTECKLHAENVRLKNELNRGRGNVWVGWSQTTYPLAFWNWKKCTVYLYFWG